MRRNLIASVLSTVFIFAGFACGAANSELYAVMPSEAESASASSSAPRAPASVKAPARSAAPAAREEEPEAVESVERDDAEEARVAGIIGLIGGPADSSGAFSGLIGSGAGSAQGFGGLGLSGIGPGSGLGTGSGFGTGSGRIGSSRSGAPPQVSMGKEVVVGKLPPEVIKRIVRQNFGRFRLCYENGLRTNPRLEGRVTVRFVIGRDGSVSNVANNSSTLPSPSVVTCVLNAFKTLSFPQPDGGIVVVTYPISFKPGASATATATATATQRPPPPPPAATP